MKLRDTLAFAKMREARNHFRFFLELERFVENRGKRSDGIVSYDGPSFIIFGPPRIGKSTVCNLVRNDIGCEYLNVDGLAALLDCHGGPGIIQAFCVKHLLRKLLKKFPHGACIDVANLSLLFVRNPRSLIRDFGCERLIPISSLADATERLKALRLHRASGRQCWTRKRFSDEDLPELAARLAERCSEFNSVTKQVELKPIFIEPDSFEEDLTAAKNEIIRRIEALCLSGMRNQAE